MDGLILEYGNTNVNIDGMGCCMEESHLSELKDGPKKILSEKTPSCHSVGLIMLPFLVSLFKILLMINYALSWPSSEPGFQ